MTMPGYLDPNMEAMTYCEDLFHLPQGVNILYVSHAGQQHSDDGGQWGDGKAQGWRDVNR